MGIIVEKDEDRSKLSRRINSDLRERAQKTSQMEDIDGVEDSEYIEGTKKTGRFSWFWFVLIFLAAASLVIIFVVS